MFDPNPEPPGERPPTVVRARLRLAAEGPRKTLATREPQAASLILRLTSIDRIREAALRENQPWLTLKGELRLRSADADPELTLSADPVVFDDTEVTSEPTASGRARRKLLLELDEASFTGAEVLKLPLPDFGVDVHHLEVTVELQLAGSVESAADANDVLDRPLNRQLLDVSPLLALDTPIADPTEHNLAFLASIPDDPFEVERLELGGEELVEGETFFQAQGRTYFRPPGKPSAPLKGRLETTDGRSFDFELGVAQTLNQRLNSLALQLQHATAMADVAAAQVLTSGGRGDDAEAVRDRLLSEAFARKVALLDSIESTLTNNQELASFYGRSVGLPVVLDGAEDEEGDAA